ncbi:MAG: hypothetical protein RR581_07765 [Eubacterium sp.]
MHEKTKTRATALPMRILKIILNGILITAAILAILYAVYTKIYPEKAPTLFGYRPYVILTNSMVPTIPVGALVIDKAVDETEPIPENVPITFKTTLGGKPAFVTHYFRYIETEEGFERYMTQGEGYQDGQYDDFVIRREDIVGTYVTHIPHLGRIAQFLQSPAAITMLLLWGVILMIENMVKRFIDYKFPDDGEPELLKRPKETRQKKAKGRYKKGQTPKHRPPDAPPLKRPQSDRFKKRSSKN